MNKSETSKENKRPQILCAFATFFTIALPAFAICVGRSTHDTWVNLAAILEERSGAHPFVLAFLNSNSAILWGIFAGTLCLTFASFRLFQKSSKVPLSEVMGKIILLLTLAACIALFYLAALMISSTLLLNPIFNQSSF